MIRHHIMRFSNRKDVKLVVMDMTGGYRKLMKELFPHAKIIVDKYHYVRQLGFALERIRIEEQKRLFRISESLKKAYTLKQQFEYVKSSTSRQEAAARLSRWIIDAQNSKLPAFFKVSLTYQNWSKEILNSF